MKPSWSHLLLALREPQSMVGFDDVAWDLLVRQAAAAGLLGRLGALATQRGVQPELPAAVWRHMQAMLTVAEAQQRAVRWELVQLTHALADLEGPVLVLKGAAYVAAGLPLAAGRLFSDIDLLVPRAQLDAAEAALMLGGWVSSHHSDYDQRYYRQWMHELPPMMQIRRRTVLDLHHSILPATARLRTRPEPIIAAAMPLVKFPRFCVPDALDQVLHSATHLFHEGDWVHGLRDLTDLDALLRAGADDVGYWDRLLARAEQLNLGRPLFYGLRYCRRLLATPVPDEVAASCPGRPSAPAARLMDGLFLPAFATAHPSCRLATSDAAAFALFVRSHWLRMPLHLLLPHLARKAWVSAVERKSEAARDQDDPPRLPAVDAR
jgi:hypothetical protein